MQIEVAAVPPAELVIASSAESSEAVAARVEHARALARERSKSLGFDPEIRVNAELDGKALERAATLEPSARKLLTDATEKMKLSARSYHRVLRVARTLADLDARNGIARAQIAEALSYRRASLTL